MACALTQGTVLDCRDSMGGMSKVWLTERANVTSTVITAGVVTAFTLDTGKRFWEYELEKFTAHWTETPQPNIQNGTLFYQQELMFVINKLNVNTRNEIMLLGKNNLIAVIQDNNGQYWWGGLDRGLDISAGEYGTGTAAADRNGYSITFQGQELNLAPGVDEDLIPTLIIPGT